MRNPRNTGTKTARKSSACAPRHPDEEYDGETLEKRMLSTLKYTATGMFVTLAAAVAVGYYTLPANVTSTYAGTTATTNNTQCR